jgi:D-beta-D-heptose 7-phosphate kinase/D-beta-D-heptose 1-phosphate adenosyltransferase
MGRVVTAEELARIREDARKTATRLVFTNGCFDIIHRGHTDLLRAARALGDMLVVAINSDDSVARLKGSRRPIVGQEDRAEVLAALEAVDYVTIFEDDTPAKIIDLVRPDVLVKGADYEIDQIVGRERVESDGGRVVRLPLRDGFSTEQILRRIASVYGGLPGGEDAGES